MKSIKSVLLSLICVSFLSGKVSAQTVDLPTNVISIQKSYSNNIPASFQLKLDSTI